MSWHRYELYTANSSILPQLFQVTPPCFSLKDVLRVYGPFVASRCSWVFLVYRKGQLGALHAANNVSPLLSAALIWQVTCTRSVLHRAATCSWAAGHGWAGENATGPHPFLAARQSVPHTQRHTHANTHWHLKDNPNLFITAHSGWLSVSISEQPDSLPCSVWNWECIHCALHSTLLVEKSAPARDL